MYIYTCGVDAKDRGMVAVSLQPSLLFLGTPVTCTYRIHPVVCVCVYKQLLNTQCWYQHVTPSRFTLPIVLYTVYTKLHNFSSILYPTHPVHSAVTVGINLHEHDGHLLIIFSLPEDLSKCSSEFINVQTITAIFICFL